MAAEQHPPGQANGDGDFLHDLSDSHERLRRQFDTFFTYRMVLGDTYTKVSNCFEHLEDDIAHNRELKDLFTEGTAKVEQTLAKDPIVLIGGQVNSGKSSLINMLLNRPVVPVNERPCTARMVRIRYSKNEYFQLTDLNGNEKGPRCPMDKKHLRKEIDLNERDCRATVSEMIEIGLDSPLLESGLQIIDTPGLSENEALNAVVNECLHGVLQVLFYVIDGNTSWRNQDAEFISNLLMRSPDVKIVYLCNKCEEDEEACAYDNSDDSDTSSDDSDYQPIPKGEIVYLKLRNSCLLSNTEDISCNRFFQISCKRLAQSRKGRVPADLYSQEYQRLLNSLSIVIRHFLYLSLREAASQLLSVITRFFQVCRVAQSRANEPAPSLLDYFDEVHCELISLVPTFRDRLRNAVGDIIASKKDLAVRTANERIGKLRHCLKPRKKNISTKSFYNVFVGLLTLAEEVVAGSKVQLTLHDMVSKVKVIASRFVRQCEDLGANGDVPALVQMFEYTLPGVVRMEGFKDFFMNFVLNLISKEKDSNGKGQMKLQELTMPEVLAMLDHNVLCEGFCNRISEELSEVGVSFRLKCKLAEFTNQLEQSSEFSRLARLTFPGESLSLMSLLSAIEHKEVILQGRIGEGKRCVVYRGKRGNMTSAARFVKDAHDASEMARSYTVAMWNLSNRGHLNILKPFDVGRASTGQVLVLVPYIETNLFQIFTDDESNRWLGDPVERLSVGLQIVEGCLFLKENGVERFDLRPNNIRMKDGCPKIDISKWRGLSVPYPPPDGKAPFHFPPECISGTQKHFPSTEDSYGCAVLIWMLACGKFIRPPFASHEIPRSPLPEAMLTISSDFGGYADVCFTPKRSVSRYREMNEILENRGGLGPLLSVVKQIVERCITDEEAVRSDISELHGLMKYSMATLPS